MSTQVLEEQTSKIIDEGKAAVKTLKKIVPTFRKDLPNYNKLKGPDVIQDFLEELEHYEAFYQGLSQFIKEKKNTFDPNVDFTPAASLTAFAIRKGIHKVIHPSHIPKQSFEQDIQVALVQVYNLYLNSLVDLVTLYKEALTFGNDDWSVSYKTQLGEKLSQYLALFSSELPCMEGQTDDIHHLVSSYRTRRQGKPGLRTRMTRAASQFFSSRWKAVQGRLTRRRGTVRPAEFRFRTRGAFNDHIAKMENKYQILHLLMTSFRLSLCEGEESCTATKRLSQYYTYEKFKEFLLFLKTQKQLDSELARPFQQEGYAEDLMKELYAVDDVHELFQPKDMPDEKICCDLNAAIAGIKIMGGKRSMTRRRRHRKR